MNYYRKSGSYSNEKGNDLAQFGLDPSILDIPEFNEDDMNFGGDDEDIDIDAIIASSSNKSSKKKSKCAP